MKYVFVLGEHRSPRFSIVIDRGSNSEWQTVYRVTIARRFPTLDKALDFFLKSIPKKDHQRLTTEITYNDKIRVKGEE